MIKPVFFFSCIVYLLFVSQVYCQTIKNDIDYKSKTIDFKNINENKTGKILSTRFILVNTGKYPLIIYNVDTECKCVQVKWNKKFIEPHSKGLFTIIYDYKNRKGFFEKKIFIRTNGTPSIELLKIKGTIM